MDLVRQPPNSTICGQCCVATLAGVTLEQAIEAVGKKGYTRTKDIKTGLQRLGIETDTRRRVGVPEDGETAVLWFVSEHHKHAHWVIWHNSKFYDPASGVHRKIPRWLRHWILMSHLKVYL